MATISAINGVDIGNVAKINGIDIANIASVNGGDVVTADFVATIDATYVDSELTDFPIGIKLNAGDGFAGYGATDWQYLHATVGGSECYVEVDVWDTTANIAVLWIKVPTVSSSSDTVINLAITDVLNTVTYVGETGDTAAQTVWDSNYVGVWHMSQDPSGGTDSILDSTVNANHGTPQVTMTSGDLIDGGFGKAIEFDGADDYVVSPTIVAQAEFTAEQYAYISTSAEAQDYLSTYSNSGSQVDADWVMFVTSAWYPGVSTWVGGYTELTYSTSQSDAYIHHAITFDDSDLLTLYIDGVSRGSASKSGNVWSNARPVAIAAYGIGSGIQDSLVGIHDEVRISSVARSAAWIKVAAQNLLGNLVAIS